MGMDGEMVKKNLTEEQRKYCIKNCEYGKRKIQELMQVCDSVFDAAADMQDFVQSCFGSSECGASKITKKSAKLNV